MKGSARQLPVWMLRCGPQSVLSGLAVPMSVFPGHVLYRKGDPATYMYILDEGGLTGWFCGGCLCMCVWGGCVVGVLGVWGS